MPMDITKRADIVKLVDTFYEKVKVDAEIGPLFTTVFKVNWEKHLLVMYDFWENMLFYSGSYAGNPLESHRRLHRVYPLKEEHFNRWVAIFNQTVDELFKGEKALLAKQRAFSIATVMKIKILNAHSTS